LGDDGRIDAAQLPRLCKNTEGKPVPYETLQAALAEIKPASKGELTKEEFIGLVAVLRGKRVDAGEPLQVRKMVAPVQERVVDGSATTVKKATQVQENSKDGKRITRLNGATESSSHTIDHEELEQFALHLNGIATGDVYLKTRSPVNADNFFESCQDGLLLCKLVNDSSPDTIDERVLNEGGGKLNTFQMTENINVAINSAKAIGCSVVNIGAVDILEGREHLVLGLVWQVIKIGLLAKISLQFHPELARLLQDGETLEEFLKLPADTILLRWFNFQLKRANCTRAVTNFGADLVDSECYLNLLSVLVPDQCSKSALGSDDLSIRAEQVVQNAVDIGCDKYISVASILRGNGRLNLAFVANLFNHYPGLEQLSQQEMAALDEALFASEGDRESRTFALWMNSLGVEPFVRVIPDDLSDGRILLQVINAVRPNSMKLRPGQEGKQLTRFQALENTNMVVEWCRKMNFSLVGIQGADLTDGSKKLTLAIVWQLMRQHIIETLKSLSREGAEVTDDVILEWANKTAQTKPIDSFKDAKLRDGRFLLRLMSQIQKGIVNFELVTEGTSDEDAKANAKYAISVARKLGATIFLLPEDIVQVQSRMILTFIGSLMAISLSRQSQ
jgi:plastin-1